ncbi:MAG: hypothetical protein FJ267_01465 [Planctomycetes bacterium]|nr:hypothetical protein [Planctomycetota bacterium]
MINRNQGEPLALTLEISIGSEDFSFGTDRFSGLVEYDAPSGTFGFSARVVCLAANMGFLIGQCHFPLRPLTKS